MIPVIFISKLTKYHPCFYAGAFLGMGRNIDINFVISVFALCVIFVAQNKFKFNAGGKLGFLAFIANHFGNVKWFSYPFFYLYYFKTHA